MEFEEVLRRRRMSRSFEDRPVSADVIDRVLRAGLRAPSAGNTQGTDFVVLEGQEQTSLYWDVTLSPARRPGFRWPGLLVAPVLVIPVVNPNAYLSRYGEPDKAATGLAEDLDRWAVPYWYTDAAFAAMLILMTAVDEGLGALFFGVFDHENAVIDALGIPSDRRLLGAIAIGHSASEDRPSRSAGRKRRGLDEVVHRGRW